MGKTLANCSRFAKFAKVFPLHRFALYGMCCSAVSMQCMLHLVSERLEVSNHFNDLLAGLLVVFNDLIISKIKAYYAYHFLIVELKVYTGVQNLAQKVGMAHAYSKIV